MYSMTLSENVQWRNFVKDKTFDDLTWLDTPRTFYLGVDCSADSMTIGNLAVFMLARHLIDAGWKAVLLVGGATSLVGDPGGKDEERDLKPVAEIEKNVEGVARQVRKLFAHNDFELVNNYEWFKDIRFVDFLRDVGKHFSMTELVQRDFVAKRIGEGGSGISYAEFSYTLFQGYDYWHLFKTRHTELQIGGSDQWGNMLSGVPLIRKREGAEVQAMSAPLVIDKKTGKKFGKSEAGAIWLDPVRTTPTEFYQFWVNVDDDRVEDFLKFYTLLDKPTIDDILSHHKAEPAKRIGQIELARAVTALVHGDHAAATAEVVTKYLTGQAPIGEADTAAVVELHKQLPHAELPDGANVVDAVVVTGLASSKSEARQLLQDKAIYLNGEPCTKHALEASDFQNGRLLIRKGKAFKNTALIERIG
jgi:tyrosyl-tRNA synthetase